MVFMLIGYLGGVFIINVFISIGKRNRYRNLTKSKVIHHKTEMKVIKNLKLKRQCTANCKKNKTCFNDLNRQLKEIEKNFIAITDAIFDRICVHIFTPFCLIFWLNHI